MCNPSIMSSVSHLQTSFMSAPNFVYVAVSSLWTQLWGLSMAQSQLL